MPVDIEIEGEVNVQQLPESENGYEILVTPDGTSGTITVSRWICQTVAPQLVEEAVQPVRMPDGRTLYRIGRLRITIESV